MLAMPTVIAVAAHPGEREPPADRRQLLLQLLLLPLLLLEQVKEKERGGTR